MKDLYPEALRLYKSKVGDMNRIRIHLSDSELKNSKEEIDDALQRLIIYRKKSSLRSIIISLILLSFGLIGIYCLKDRAGLIDLVIIGAIIGGGIGLLSKGIAEYIRVK